MLQFLFTTFFEKKQLDICGEPCHGVMVEPWSEDVDKMGESNGSTEKTASAVVHNTIISRMCRV